MDEDRRFPDTRLSRTWAPRVAGPLLLSSYLELGNDGARVFACYCSRGEIESSKEREVRDNFLLDSFN